MLISDANSVRLVENVIWDRTIRSQGQMAIFRALHGISTTLCPKIFIKFKCTGVYLFQQPDTWLLSFPLVFGCVLQVLRIVIPIV